MVPIIKDIKIPATGIPVTYTCRTEYVRAIGDYNLRGVGLKINYPKGFVTRIYREGYGLQIRLIRPVECA